jgi:hypothetical protein
VRAWDDYNLGLFKEDEIAGKGHFSDNRPALTKTGESSKILVRGQEIKYS